jgi:hypothetical protein
MTIDGLAMSTSPAAAQSKRSTPRQCWRRNSPTSLVRAPLRFTSEQDRECFREGIRTLALVYVGILMLVVVVTALHGDWRKRDVRPQATAGATDVVRRY